MKITILGSSSATPTHDRHPSSQILTTHDSHYLIDCGEGTLFRLNVFKIKKNRIRAIFISHLHGDHFYGLIGLLTTMSMQERTEKLTIVSPARLREIIELQCAVSKTQIRFEIEYIEFSDNEPIAIYRDQNIMVQTVPLCHKITTCGFVFHKQYPEYTVDRDKIEQHHLSNLEIKEIVETGAIEKEGKKIEFLDIAHKSDKSKSYAYLSDTEYYESCLPTIQSVDLLYHESTFVEKDRDRATLTKHSTASDAAKIALASHAKRLIVGHFSARYTDLNMILDEASAIFPNTELAIEGRSFEV